MTVWQRLWAPAGVAMGLVLIVLGVWQVAVWDDVGDSTCGPLYRPDIWTASNGCLQRSLPRLGVVLLCTVVAVGLLIVAIRALLAEKL